MVKQMKIENITHNRKLLTRVEGVSFLIFITLFIGSIIDKMFKLGLVDYDSDGRNLLFSILLISSMVIAVSLSKYINHMDQPFVNWAKPIVNERWIHQTKFGDEGNCAQAAIASLLGLRLEQVPEFPLHDATVFWEDIEVFLNSKGLTLFYMPQNMRPDFYYLASGKSPRGRNHMVVAQGSKIVHDPHPDGDGLLSFDRVYMIVPTDYVEYKRSL